MDDEKKLLTKQQSQSSDAIYHDSSQSPRAKMFQIFFVTVVILMVLLSISLSVYRATVLGSNGPLYLMLGLSLLGFAIVELLMIFFIRREDLPKSKVWFLYLVGGCVILEAIFTDVLLFQ